MIGQVLTTSAATIDRRLAPARVGPVARRGIAHTRPGTMLKSSIPLKRGLTGTTPSLATSRPINQPGSLT